MSNEEIDLATLRDSFREVLTDSLPFEALLNASKTSPALWAQITDLGWPGLAIGQEHGGLGLGFDALGLLYEEIGRTLAPLPFLPTMLVAEAIARGGSAHQQVEWLPRLASGTVIASLTLPGDAPTVRATREGDELVLNGSAWNLLDGAQCGLLLVAVLIEGEVCRVLIDGQDATAVHCFDLTRSLARVDLEGICLPAANLLPRSVEASLAEHASIALACEAVGGAERILEITLDYLKTRQQFGRVIGSFQALKHRAANHKTDIVAISALTREAAAMRARGEDVGLEASAAKAYACDVYAKLARDAIQLHGGIGVTWEHICHLYLKRAKLSEALYGTTAQHLDALTKRLAA